MREMIATAVLVFDEGRINLGTVTDRDTFIVCQASLHVLAIAGYNRRATIPWRQFL